MELELEKHGLSSDKSGATTSNMELEELARQIKGDPNEFTMFKELLKSIQGGYRFNDVIINSLFIYKLEGQELFNLLSREYINCYQMELS